MVSILVRVSFSVFVSHKYPSVDFTPVLSLVLQDRSGVGVFSNEVQKIGTPLTNPPYLGMNRSMFLNRRATLNSLNSLTRQ